ncbi:hypothetical protein BMW24_013825 [Mycobacterium heckeshornense]|uniref:Uncharacterized protein n=1 Tax=Mycobacterium heckeshornense TaxID=110505 RepID=A0A2G8B8E7_9MYCO|nr:hypothetical protein ACT16_12575 [Mycobacterium heckeshornense]PIJ34039.1 hypothetical protein BMW24_013825 [Mycobacterium heckeshornense]BCO37435.1 hypothetical protein MHEC_38680 [Mycobacterium heckeshornense]
MSPSRTSAPLKAFNWLSTNRYGMVLSSAFVLAFAGLECYNFFSTHNAIHLIFALFILGIVINGWVQVYRHRNDPSWPPKLRWVLRERAE